MSSNVYARGIHAVGHCARSGIKMKLLDMVEDPRTGLMVHPDWAELPDRIPITYVDGIALYRTAPDLDNPGVNVYLQTAINIKTGFKWTPIVISASVSNVSTTVT